MNVNELEASMIRFKKHQNQGLDISKALQQIAEAKRTNHNTENKVCLLEQLKLDHQRSITLATHRQIWCEESFKLSSLLSKIETDPFLKLIQDEHKIPIVCSEIDTLIQEINNIRSIVKQTTELSHSEIRSVFDLFHRLKENISSNIQQNVVNWDCNESETLIKYQDCTRENFNEIPLSLSQYECSSELMLIKTQLISDFNNLIEDYQLNKVLFQKQINECLEVLHDTPEDTQFHILKIMDEYAYKSAKLLNERLSIEKFSRDMINRLVPNLIRLQNLKKRLKDLTLFHERIWKKLEIFSIEKLESTKKVIDKLKLEQKERESKKKIQEEIHAMINTYKTLKSQEKIAMEEEEEKVRRENHLLSEKKLLERQRLHEMNKFKIRMRHEEQELNRKKAAIDQQIMFDLQEKERKERQKINLSRVKYRLDKINERQQLQCQKFMEKQKREKLLNDMLERLKAKVSVDVKTDPSRVMQNTIASSLPLQKHIDHFQVNSFTDTKILSDIRARINLALFQKGANDSKYAKELMLRLEPKSKPHLVSQIPFKMKL